MANPLTIRGELSHDIGLLNAEVSRLASISRELKSRRTRLIDDAEKDEKAFETDYQHLIQRTLSPENFNKQTKERLTLVANELRSFVIEDSLFDKELERAKEILEQVKKQFPGMESVIHISDAESKLSMAEIYITARLKSCMTFIQQTLNPLMSFNSYAYVERIRNVKAAFDNACTFAKDIDDVTLKAMGQLLKFYGTLLKNYPVLIKILVKDSWRRDSRVRSRILE